MNEVSSSTVIKIAKLSGRNYQMPSTAGTHDSEVQRFDTGRLFWGRKGLSTADFGVSKYVEIFFIEFLLS